MTNIDDVLRELNKVGYSRGLHVIRLPLKGRNIAKMIKRLEPLRVGDANIWILCDNMKCWTCISYGEYNVIRNNVMVYDRLSGLRHRVPTAVGVVGDRIVWKIIWGGESLELLWEGCDTITGTNAVRRADSGE